VLTDETVALKLALVAFAATVTDAGTVTLVLLLDRLTLTPPLGAAAFTVTVQASVPDPVIEELVQVSALSTGVAAAVVVPVSATSRGDPVALLAMESEALNVPAAAGLSSTEIVQLAPAASELPQVVVGEMNDAMLVPVKLLVPSVTVDVPVFFTVTTCGAVATPKALEGKLRLAGDTVTVATPVQLPLKATTEVVPVTLLLLAIVSPPVTVPVAVGLNCTVRASD